MNAKNANWLLVRLWRAARHFDFIVLNHGCFVNLKSVVIAGSAGLGIQW